VAAVYFCSGSVRSIQRKGRVSLLVKHERNPESKVEKIKTEEIKFTSGMISVLLVKVLLSLGKKIVCSSCPMAFKL
jgi:hypothetical protein